MTLRRLVAALVGLALVLVAVRIATGTFTFTGVNSMTLPFSKGGSDDDYTVTVYMDNVANLVPNSEVKVSEVTVGSVRKIELEGWRAKLTIGLERGTELPANTTARVAQKSLLGAEYLELDPPPDPSRTLLADGDEIGLDRTSRYPETEEALAAVSLLLNGGGLHQVSTITQELNNLFDGRRSDVRNFVDQLDDFVTNLDRQKDNIVLALDRLDRLGGAYADRAKVLTQALRQLPHAIDVLSSQRRKLVATLRSVGDFGDVTHQIVTRSQRLLVDTTDHLAGTLAAVADAGDSLADAIDASTFPFPVRSVVKAIRGDYMNLFFTVDLSMKSFERDYLGGTPLGGVYSSLLGLMPPSSTAQKDLLENPIQPSDEQTAPGGAEEQSDADPGGQPGDGGDGRTTGTKPDGPPTEDHQGSLGDLLNLLGGGA